MRWSRHLTLTCHFNPRSREGSDKVGWNNVTILFTISIHAPVKGATRQAEDDLKRQAISIHAPVKGATGT